MPSTVPGSVAPTELKATLLGDVACYKHAAPLGLFTGGSFCTTSLHRHGAIEALDMEQEGN